MKPAASCFRILKYGPVTVERASAGRSFTFTRAHARQAVAWFNRLGRRLAIDYEHQSLPGFNERPDRRSPAAGWIGKLEARDDGLYAADVEYTELARSMLERGEYGYFSPVIYWSDDRQTAVKGLGPVALTNDPAIRNAEPLMLAASRKGEPMYMTVLKTEIPGTMMTVAGKAGGTAKSKFVAAFRALMAATNGMAEPELVRDLLNDLGHQAAEQLGNLGGKVQSALHYASGSAEDDIDEAVAKYESEFSGSRALQEEFGSVEAFCAYRRAEAQGLIRRSGGPATHTRQRTSRPRSTFTALAADDAVLRDEFGGDMEAFEAYRQAQAAGLVTGVS